MSTEGQKKLIRRNRVVTENHLNYLLELHMMGVDIGPDDTQLLRDANLLQDEIPVPKPEEIPFVDNINEYSLGKKSDEQSRIDALIDIVEGEINTSHIMTDVDLETRRQKGGFVFEGRSKPITKEDWMPESNTEHTKEFIEWVSSITMFGFEKRRQYRLLTLYVQQAYTWLAENKTLSDYDTVEDKEDFMLREIERSAENTLYFLNKYAYYKEGDEEEGEAKYIAAPGHEIMIYLNDAGYSTAYAKGRQMAATTTLMLCDMADVIFKRNHIMKFITEDKEKAEEIFEDKLKYPFSRLPDWIRPVPLNDRENFFRIGKKDEKGDRGGVNSTIRVVAPKKTAIAGGAPNKVKIDEAGNIGILSKMIENQRPTMLKYDPKTGKLKMKRQLQFWGTGGEMEKGGKAFETEFMALWNSWQKGDFSSCIVPVFFDWTARPGATKEDYDREKKVAYSKVGPESKESITTFHQTWPTSLSDVFKTSGKTLVDEEYIKSSEERIRAAMVKTNFQLCKKGYFEPIYDMSSPSDEYADVPYKIIDVNFVPVDDFDPRGWVTIFMEPDKKYAHRYYQGTDPIMSDSGISNMASAVWDKFHKTISCVVNFRTGDPREPYLQCLLMGLYYDTTKIGKKGIKELTESNIGPPYCQYRVNKGFDQSIVLNYELPPYLQNHSTKNEGMGIDNKTPRTSTIINKLHELIHGFGDRVYLEVFFTQLETFVCTITAGGTETWGPANKKYFRDDVLFACVYAYICGEYCYPELIPMNMSSDANRYTWVKEYFYDRKNDCQLRSRMVKKQVA